MYIWKEQSVFCEREERGIVRVTVKKERAQPQDVRSAGEKGGGGTLSPHPAEAQYTKQGLAVTSRHPTHPLCPRHGILSPNSKQQESTSSSPLHVPLRRSLCKITEPLRDRVLSPSPLHFHWASTKTGAVGRIKGLGSEFEKHPKTQGMCPPPRGLPDERD